MFRTYEQYLKLLDELRILWKHDGNPQRPHAHLTKGGHSDGFFNGSLLLDDSPRLARELCFDFIELKVRSLLPGLPTPQRVIGPAFGAITLASKIADALDVATGFAVHNGLEGDNKIFTMDTRFDVKGASVLPVEDTITTGSSVEKCIKASIDAGAQVMPIILAICNRSGLKEIGGRKIVAMFDIPMHNWEPEVCPLCKQGSEPIRPKVSDNWTLLTAVYPN